MRQLITVIALMICSNVSYGTTFKEFSAKTDAQQAAFVSDFIDKMTTDLRAKNPDLAVHIRDWYAVKAPGKPTSEGMERLYIELGAIELRVKRGQTDPSTVQVESVIVWVTKQKFPAKPDQK